MDVWHDISTNRPGLFEGWITLSMVEITIQWIEIYPAYKQLGSGFSNTIAFSHLVAVFESINLPMNTI